MASNPFPDPNDRLTGGNPRLSGDSLWDNVKWVLRPLASLRLTVTLFAMAMFHCAGRHIGPGQDGSVAGHQHLFPLRAAVQLSRFTVHLGES